MQGSLLGTTAVTAAAAASVVGAAGGVPEQGCEGMSREEALLQYAACGCYWLCETGLCITQLWGHLGGGWMGGWVDETAGECGVGVAGVGWGG